MKQLEIEEVRNMKKKDLIKYCQENKIKYSKLNSEQLKQRICETLIESTNLIAQPTHEPSINENNYVPEDSIGSLFKDGEIDSGPVNPKKNWTNSLESKTVALLPVSLDEMGQIWHRGFICHPQVLAELSNGSSAHHESSDMVGVQTINPFKRYNTTSKIFLILNLPSEQFEINYSWLAPISIIKTIKVESSEELERLKRTLINTPRGFESNLHIEVEKVNISHNVETITENDNLDTLSKVVKDFKFMDSLLGAFAISLYMEKHLYWNGEHPNKQISRKGSFFSRIFVDRKDANLTNLPLIKFFSEKIKGRLNKKNSGFDNFDELLESIRKRERTILIDYANNYERRDSKISPFDLKNYNDAIEDELLKNAIEAIPKTKYVRDPFLLFHAFLSKFQNTETPASGDRQSFVFAILNLKEKMVLNSEESILLSYLLGYFIGYGMCWRPVLENHNNEWDGDNSYLDLLLSFSDISAMLEEITKYTELQLYRDSSLDKGKSKDVTFSSKKLNSRKLRICDDLISINDKDLNMFKSAKRNGKYGLLLNILISDLSEGNLRSSLKAIHDYSENPERIYEIIENDLFAGKYSEKERAVITALAQLDS